MDLLPDILRAVITNTMLAVLLFTLARPKYGKLTQYAALATIILLDCGANLYFYLQRDYTTLSKVDVLFFVVIGFLVKPLFQETLMQWLFNCFTVLNVYAIAVVTSYHLCDFFPYPYYSISLLRLAVFGLAVMLFHKRLRPFYRQAAEHWTIYLIVSAGLFMNFAWYFVASADVEQMLTENVVSLVLLVLLTVFVYLSIFLSLRKALRQQALQEEKLRSDARQELLQSELLSQEAFVNLAKQNRHDLRHHNALVLDYLDRGDVAGAKEYLLQHDVHITNTAWKQYCKNPVVNAVLRLYARRAENSGTDFSVQADIPETLPLTAPETGELFSNLLENACEACDRVAHGWIAVTARTDSGSLRLEVRNSVVVSTVFDEAGLPCTTKDGGGTGVKSAVFLVKQSGGMLRFSQTDGVFTTQMVLPIQ